MLYRFLEAIYTGERHSLLEVAQALGVSPGMALQVAADLTNRGYLQEVGASCTAPQAACSGCSASSSCQVIVRRWFLTDKGRAALYHQQKPGSNQSSSLYSSHMASISRK